ncbi:hypothetical protein G6N82_02645 [Altererythrobacter sp. BO-6]|uniref:hypothetical protein n=1 Tax=Altererythrobacter sp. BO-6 TaxID=2604537 RepID=UPI0013E17379|nr:hypothetical protein [Altererythrobacter sp. BO-6]QIG53197.1 hypothetical protein G6N82_02645 [Altererythrobacter sp. BO-6]
MRQSDRNAIAVTVGLNAPIEEEELAIYRGQIVLLPPTPASIELCAHARTMVEEAFHPYDPRTAQHVLDIDDFVARAANVKPRFIHDPQTRILQKAYLAELGFDPWRTYLDVPRMRVVSSDGYLVSGVGHKQPPHRDTWWSAPMQQIQFWLPIFPMTRECSMEFYPHYVESAVANSSNDFNIYNWNATGRKNAAQHRMGEDNRGIPQPNAALEHPGAVQMVLPVGGAVIFSANQLHATSDNVSGMTRFSIDFRIVDIEHVRHGIGARNVDNASTGTALRDFRRISDEQEIAPDIVSRYDEGEKPQGGVLRFAPDEVVKV